MVYGRRCPAQILQKNYQLAIMIPQPVGLFQDGAYGRDGLLYLQKMMPIGRAVFGPSLSGASLEGLES